MKILIVEDDFVTNKRLELLLKNKYEVICKYNGSDAYPLLKEDKIDLVILDLNLPDFNGLEVCKSIRNNSAKYGNVIILMLTARDTTEDLVSGFEAGADDYLKKPFEDRELLCRVEALLRRDKKYSRILKYHNLTINLDEFSIDNGEKDIILSKTEFQLFTFFVQNKNIILSREKIMNDIWDMPYFPESRKIDYHIKKIKEKIPAFKDNLNTIVKVGYKLIEK